ncbi:putative ATPase/DNA-binding CsgD family transcriptional regulator [Nocardioides daedukensis]|uniref:Putative ATPase/DNA-binding CsgD family transcriptional regulator n=1 Tax=Nocardioides daedukensis TaxID=634462 RepID=A0A7Y9UU29_9ACTN|nr:LuxR C-terminal-related transcriptional regulator [Nocardioides daedukensis]NYG59834.1 putative ATPase/DNA-binding CsgD family transcriptional regulator [Nocardioides daedukensis]
MNSDEWERIRTLHASGETIKGISRRTGFSRNTIRRALQLSAPPDDRRGTRSTLYDAHSDSIKELLSTDPEITVQAIKDTIGWEHASSTLARAVARAREELAADVLPDPAQGRQLTAPGTPTLPHFSTTFIGRRPEIARLRGLLGEHRLVTITGPGGMGKTRLATHTAQEVRRAFSDGVRFVELASLRSPELIAQTVLEGLNLAGRDQQGATAEAALIDHLGDRRMLLVLDNCEHLVDAVAGLVHTLLQATTGLAIIVTSREVLALPEEFVLPLGSLPMPDTDAPGHDPLDSATALFESRADAVLSGFRIDDSNREAVRRVCERLDGLPLAIELACARLPVLSVSELADRLDHRLDLLTTGNRAAPSRHQSLIATLDWSHDHCTAEQQLLWSRASVFAGGFDLAMAEEICANDELTSPRILDAIMALVSKSILLREEHESSVRFRMLETIREYGQSHLSEDALDGLHERLLAWTLAKVRELVVAWPGPDQRRINGWFRANRANVRKALHWALDESTCQDVRRTAAQVVAEPWFLWAGGASVREHRLWLDRAVERVDADSEVRGQALATLALVQTLQGDRDGAGASLTEAERIAALTGDAATADFVEHTRGLREYFAGDFPAAEPLLLEALSRYRANEPRGGLRSALDVHLGMLYAFTGQAELSEQHYREVHERSGATGERWFKAYADFGLGAVELLNGDAERAHQMALGGLTLIRDFDDEIGATLIIDLLGWTEAVLGETERAALLVGSASNLWGAFGRQLYGSHHWVDVRERYSSLAREQLGADRYDELHAEGAAMSVSDVIAFALDESVVLPESAAVADTLAMLTPREREVAGLVAKGLSNKEIAARLVLSPRTIEGHVEHVLQKLCLTSRTQIPGTLT